MDTDNVMGGTTEWRVSVKLECIVLQEAKNPGEAVARLAASGLAELQLPMYNVRRELVVVGKEGVVDNDTGEFHLFVGTNGTPKRKEVEDG